MDIIKWYDETYGKSKLVKFKGNDEIPKRWFILH
jgi:hypothetical protein